MIKYALTKAMEDDMTRKRKGGYAYVVTKECFRQDYKRQISSRGILNCDVPCRSVSEAAKFVCGFQANGNVFWHKM